MAFSQYTNIRFYQENLISLLLSAERQFISIALTTEDESKLTPI